ncbi:hypothetical protein J4423_01715 [Candidatus Pacearchaeota archaeon]|nr:hypothetical protein [Candidatus Pacearchaeota archaeon]
MLTTLDLYQRVGYGIDFGDRVRFVLRRGYELKVSPEYGAGMVQKSSMPNTNRTVVSRIQGLRPQQPGELEIDCTLDDGTPVWLKITHCRSLKILE